MFDLIKKVLTKTANNNDTVNSGNTLPKTQIAACVVLLEAAHADNDCTDEEMDHVLETLKNHFGLSGIFAEELVELAHSERNNAVDLWQFTNNINQEFSKEEKISVMESVWKIVHTDGHLDMHEDHFAHKLANLLRLTHKEMIDAKLRAKEQ